MRKLRWDCKEKGICFRDLCPKLGTFDACFPGKIGMSDIDGFVEVNGHILFLEWKSDGGFLRIGQTIAFQKLTRLSDRITVIVVQGDPKAMTVETVKVFHRGEGRQAEICDIEGLKGRLARWAERARAEGVLVHG